MRRHYLTLLNALIPVICVCALASLQVSAELSSPRHRRVRAWAPLASSTAKTTTALAGGSSASFVGCPSASFRLRGSALTASSERTPSCPASSPRPPPRDSAHWHIWRTADRLERDGLSYSGDERDNDNEATRKLTVEVSSILRRWGETWAGRPEWRGLLNKSSLTHEVEESVVALRSLLEWMDASGLCEEGGGSDARRPAVLVDACCGKGVLSMLASYLLRDDPRVGRIVMLDRAPIKWDHVDAANERAEAEGRPVVEAWGGCNLHDVDGVADRLRSLDAPCLVVGIHLCKMLSPACAGIVNALGPERCPFLCLAPCCLPRAVLSGRAPSSLTTAAAAVEAARGGGKVASIEVRQYETPQQREERRLARERRDNAMLRRPAMDCYLCRSPSHPVHRCYLLPSDETERVDVFRRAAAAAPCWKCGEMGHFKVDCPSDQSAGKPSLIRPPATVMDVSDVLASPGGPFEEYCCRLAAAIQREHVRLVDARLTNDGARHQAESNWNQGRKSIYILAST